MRRVEHLPYPSTTHLMTEQRFRFVVSSAEEAVKVLRERLGEHARVISVRQVEGTGLARFLQAPKLEVIAENVPPATAVAEMPRTDGSDGTHELPIVPAIAAIESVPAGGPLARLLHAGGVSAQIIGRIRSDPEWRAFEAMAPGAALTRIGMMLRAQFRARPRRALGNRVAFLGSPGAGTTTALCKWLAAEVFVRQRGGVVLKLDLDRANPGDALAVFCDALGIACVRSIPDVPALAPDQSLFIDVPGIIPGRDAEAAELTAALGPLFTTARVMVINAAYDAALIKRSCEFAARADCTHVAFTHLDELTHWGKLWDFLLGSNLTPLFLGTGPNIAGDFDENVFDATLARTFPEAGVQAAEIAA